MSIINIVAFPLGSLMSLCYALLKNYGLAIILFTILTKVILLPISIWVHKNGIKVVRLQPEINRLKAKFFGDGDSIAEGQAELFKREKYNPFASVIPLIIQIILLMGLVNVIYHPLNNLLQLEQGVINELIATTCAVTGMSPEISSIQLSVVAAVQGGAFATEFGAVASPAIISNINALDLQMFGLNLAQVPSQVGGILLCMPLLAGLSALILCLVQNKLNPLQAEQGAWGKFGTTSVSVGISLFLGAFVPAGVGFYWICSNLLTIVQQLMLNAIIDPKKHINYDELEKSKKALEEMNALGGSKKKLFQQDPNAKRERADYKRFFTVANKHVVFYSEKSGFYKYFEDVMEYLLGTTNLTIHYVTSDPNDVIFDKAEKNAKIRPYYIGEKKLITLMMKMDADIVVMTMPDLDNFHLKRSYVRKDIEYIYMFHYPLSTHMVLRKGALDNYDTIFCVGDFQFDEIRQSEELYGLPKKNLVSCGYGQLEKLYRSYQAMDKVNCNRKKILIAPSWQEDNILDSCIDDLLAALLGHGYEVVVRPHPEYVKRYGAKMDAIVARYADYKGNDLIFELDFTSNDSIFNSDVVISEWSGTAYEFSLVTQKPSVFINTTPKINNPEYDKIKAVPLELLLRDKVGIQMEPNNLKNALNSIETLLSHAGRYNGEIFEIRKKYIANFGKSGEIGGQYIIRRLQERKAK